MKEAVLITGATAGIGRATAYKFASEGRRIIITGRRKDRLKEIESVIKEKFKTDVLSLTFDVRDRKQVEKNLNALPKEWEKIGILVNNAGLAAGFHDIDEGDEDDWERMIDTNVKGLLYVSKAISKKMVNNGGGHIINVGSIAGREVYPKGNVYTASKFAVDALTKGMRIDLVSKNIKVSQVAPGLVNTEFAMVRFHGDKEKADQVYNGMKPLTGEDIAEVIFFIASAPEHVNIADILVLPKDQATSTIVHRHE